MITDYILRPRFVTVSRLSENMDAVAGKTKTMDMYNAHLFESTRYGEVYPYFLINGEKRYLPRDGYVVKNEDKEIIDLVSPIRLERDYGSVIRLGEEMAGLWLVSEDGQNFEGPGSDTKQEAIDEYLTDKGKDHLGTVYVAKCKVFDITLDYLEVCSLIAEQIQLIDPTWPGPLPKKTFTTVCKLIPQVVLDVARQCSDLPPTIFIDSKTAHLTPILPYEVTHNTP